MKSLQIAEHLCRVLAGGRTIQCPISLDASVRKDRDGSIWAPILAVEGILEAQSLRLIFQSDGVTQSNPGYIQRWSRLERETRQLK